MTYGKECRWTGVAAGGVFMIALSALFHQDWPGFVVSVCCLAFWVWRWRALVDFEDWAKRDAEKGRKPC